MAPAFNRLCVELLYTSKGKSAFVLKPFKAGVAFSHLKIKALGLPSSDNIITIVNLRDSTIQTHKLLLFFLTDGLLSSAVLC